MSHSIPPRRSGSISRREALRRGLAAAAAGALAGTTLADTPGDGRYREAALKAARWLQSRKVAVGGGAAWSSGENKDGPFTVELYHGVSGVVLFFLDAHRATGEADFLADATAGADYLLAQVTRDADTLHPGLYTGLAGVGHCLGRVAQATGRAKYRDGYENCRRAVVRRARPAGAGVEWDDATDVIAGGAGIGLWLLEASRTLNDPECVRLAWLCGKRLVGLGRDDRGGLKWAYQVKGERLMPNFSHGTAGIAYFLATLYRWTRQREFLDAALAGARYLRAVARTDGDTCQIFHHEPGGEDLFYLGWCHGPTGTARLFYRLYQATGDREWMTWVRRCAKALLDSGIPRKRTPGFWDNDSVCCGTAGVGDFLIHLHRLTGEEVYREAAGRMADEVLRKATPEAGGLKWVSAEHRVKPDFRVAQNGYMQGAAGIGWFLLRLDDARRGRPPAPTLPDCPFTEA
jgi:lantibiotic modifying enzyme